MISIIYIRSLINFLVNLWVLSTILVIVQSTSNNKFRACQSIKLRLNLMSFIWSNYHNTKLDRFCPKTRNDLSQLSQCFTSITDIIKNQNMSIFKQLQIDFTINTEKPFTLCSLIRWCFNEINSHWSFQSFHNIRSKHEGTIEYSHNQKFCSWIFGKNILERCINFLGKDIQVFFNLLTCVNTSKFKV